MPKKGTKAHAQKLPTLTDSFVEDVGRPSKSARFYYDRSRSGFGVKIYPPTQDKNRQSARVYGVRVTVEGNLKRWFTIGAHKAPWDAKTARAEAQAIRQNIERGLDPFAHRGDRRASLYTLADLAVAFFDEYKIRVADGERSEDTLKRYKRQWDENVPGWLKKTRVANLQPSLYKKAHREISKPKNQEPRLVEGNRTLAMLSAMLGWTLSLDQDERKGLTENHCLTVVRYQESTTRGIWMEDQDQAKLLAFLLDPANRYESWWAAERLARKEANRHGEDRIELRRPAWLITNQSADALLMLFLTGLRSWEVMALRWDELHHRSKSISVLQTKRGADPGSSVERKRIFVTDEVNELLATIPETSEWVFPTKGRGKKAASGHIENLQDSWERVRVRLHLPKVRLHDLRHTAASEVGDDEKVSAPDLQANFGWLTQQTAMRYWHSRARARDSRVQSVTTNRISRIKATNFEDDEQDGKGQAKPSIEGKSDLSNTKKSPHRLELGKVTTPAKRGPKA